MGLLLKTIVIIFCIYLILRYMYLKLVPEPVRQIITQMRASAKQMQQQQGHNPTAPTQESQNKPEGSVTITNNNTQTTRKNTTSNNKAQDDFTDYEEVD